jgi:adenylate cyclase
MNQLEDELSIHVELVNTIDNSRLWGKQYKRETSEIFNIQEEITNSIVENLQLRLTGEELKRITKSSGTNGQKRGLKRPSITSIKQLKRIRIMRSLMQAWPILM